LGVYAAACALLRLRELEMAWTLLRGLARRVAARGKDATPSP